MVALLLNVCDNRVENKTTDGNNNADGNETSPPQPQAKFAVTYAGIYATATGAPPSIDLGSGNDGSTLAKAYTITLNTNSSVAPAGLIITQFKPTFKPAAAATDATFAIQAIDPTTGADLTAATEVFDTKFGTAKLVFQDEATGIHAAKVGWVHNPSQVTPTGTKIPASNTGYLAYKITITPKPGSTYDGPKAYVFIKIAIRG